LHAKVTSNGVPLMVPKIREKDGVVPAGRAEPGLQLEHARVGARLDLDLQGLLQPR
jgi:hypothetical protein